MSSPFDRENQQEQTTSKLVVALEKLSESFRVLLWEQTKAHGLSPIQIQILIYLKNHDHSQAKPAVLATELNVTRPTISDALSALKKKALLKTQPNPADSRSKILYLSPKAEKLYTEIEQYAHPLEAALGSLADTTQSDLLHHLLKVIGQLESKQVINPQRTCFSCIHYKGDTQGTHHCSLLERDLTNGELRIDCPEHQAA